VHLTHKKIKKKMPAAILAGADMVPGYQEMPQGQG
jgi:hypothetical protein